MSPGGAWKGRVSPGYSGVGSAISFFGTFIRENENAGGSAICIHRDILPEEAIVTHLITCQGRDHLVNLQSGRHNLVNVNVHFEPELSLRQLRDRLHLINTRTGLLIPMEWALFWVTSTSVIQKKDDFRSGTRHSPMVTRERLQRFIPFFHMFLKLLSLITRGGTPQPLGSYALCQGLIVSSSIYLWLRRVIFTATPMSAAACPSVNHSWIFSVLENTGLPGFLCRFLRSVYSDSITHVDFAGADRGQFLVARGVRQGCPASGFFLRWPLTLSSDGSKRQSSQGTLII